MKPIRLVVIVALVAAACDTSATAPRGPEAAVSAGRGGAPAQEIVAGDLFSCALNARGEASCWGSNTYGMLGTGDFQDATSPGHVVTDVAFGAFSGAGSHVCALGRSGDAYCWGQNASGELGAATSDTCLTPAGREIACSATPVAVSGGLKFRTLDAGWRHNCGLTADGTAYCWGWNEFGQLGARTTETCLADGLNVDPCSHTPVPVGGNLRFRAISAGFWQTCGLTVDDQTYCWGSNALGSFGNGATGLSGPDPVPGASGVVLSVLSSGSGAACGITADRVTMCWGGFNVAGELGDGTNTRHLTPQPISGDFVSVRSVNAMVENNVLAHMCGIGGQGEARCWGSNRRGQLGTATTQICTFGTLFVFGCSNVPLNVSGDDRFQSIATGNEHTCGLTKTGDVRCWGRNDRGQVGDGSTVDRPVPVPVALP